MGHNGQIAVANRYTLGDTEPPSTPAQPTAISICQTTFTLNWTASTDNVGVTGYEVYKGGVLHVDAGDVLTYNVTGQTAGASANWQVLAYDAAGNESSLSTIRSVTQGVSVTSFSINATGQASSGQACTNTPFSTTRYLTGGNHLPTNGEIIYTNSCGTTRMNGGGDWYSNGSNAFTVSSVGVVGSLTICTE